MKRYILQRRRRFEKLLYIGDSVFTARDNKSFRALNEIRMERVDLVERTMVKVSRTLNK